MNTIVLKAARVAYINMFINYERFRLNAKEQSFPEIPDELITVVLITIVSCMY